VDAAEGASPVTAAAVVLLAIALLYVSPHGVRLLGEARLRARARRTRSLALTFDDGPGPELTPKLLELLRAHGARATFFPLGMRAELAPEVLDRVAAEDHEIGCHAQSHVNAWLAWPHAVVADVAAGFRTLARWLPPRPLFRPPHGKLALSSWLAARRRRARLGWWTLDSGDTHPELPPPDAIVRAVARASGGVVLLHDFDRGPERVGYVLEVTRRLLELARAEGLSVVPLGALVRRGRTPPRVLAVASGGGHWMQLRRLAPALEGCDVAWVTVNDGYRAEVGGARFYRVPDATRWDRLGVVRLACRMLWIVLCERPDAVVSTGAAPGSFALVFGRLVGARTAWIDSIANVEELSLGGQRAGRFADLWLTQWAHLAREGGPAHVGSVV
jgi:peptidoglycan/xylan/chitin deacetylase (PgdA/CDA1 family)